MWPPQELINKIVEFGYYLGHSQRIFDELDDVTDTQKKQLRRIEENIIGLLSMFTRIVNGKEYDEKSFEY